MFIQITKVFTARVEKEFKRSIDHIWRIMFDLKRRGENKDQEIVDLVINVIGL